MFVLGCIVSHTRFCKETMFATTQQLWAWHQAYQHHEQLPVAFGGRWPSWNSDLDNRPW
eukprot:JP448524.1.p3 GENE.JP448524.1~~JP448524.1.p3  ORF type:complete len:59 (+),score=2.78 JP448524.1:185-361(+)